MGFRNPLTRRIAAALSTAEAAWTAANGKNSVRWATTAPTGAGTAPGDVWWRHAGGTVIGQWEWDGTAWQARALGSDVIAGLDVGKLTAGVLAVGQSITAGDPAGSHVVLDGDGLRKYATNGTDVEVDLSASGATFSGTITGSAVIGGDIYTSLTGPAVHLHDGLEPARETELLAIAAQWLPDTAVMLPGATVGGAELTLDPATAGAEPGGLVAASINGQANWGGDTLDTEVAVTQLAGPGADAPALTFQLLRLIPPPGSPVPVVELSGATLKAAIFRLETAPDGSGPRLTFDLFGDLTADATRYLLKGRSISRPWELRLNLDDFAYWHGVTVTLSALANRDSIRDEVLAHYAPGLPPSPIVLWVTDAPPGEHLQVWDGSGWTVVGYRPAGASTTAAGIVELATSAETTTGTDTTRAVTPAGLAARTATDTRTGLVELATSAETTTGTDTTRAVTPAGLAARTSTTTRAGIVELATAAEATTGTDTTRAVTPAGAAAALDARETSSWAAPSLTNGWAQFDAANRPVGYTRRGGVVYLRGWIAAGTEAAAAFTLPVGFRPSQDQTFGVIAGGSATTGRVNVLANGQVVPVAPGTVSWAPLDTISFPVG